VNDLRIVPLARDHQLEQFDSGAEDLDRWLTRFALVADAAGTARTYVLAAERRVLGYYALAPAAVDRVDLPERHARGTPRHPIGVILLARLAIDRTVQRQGYGKALVADAGIRALQAADLIGARALLVHARDDDAARFYERLGFLRSPTDERHLLVLMKDLRRTFGPAPPD
jgi:GNAT superfamily N-acetyltransferase